ncbi:MAG: hypothetical protein ABIE42_00685 [Candidatus Eisenbacteria bacterium]
MKRCTVAGLVSPLLAGVLVVGLSLTAQAAGTASGTSVDNTATIDYQVGGVDQTPVTDIVSFVVDNRIDLTVSTNDVAAVVVVPGAGSQVLTFTVTNDGNTTQDYSLTAQVASGTWGGATDNFDATGVQVFVDGNGNGIYEPATDTASYIDELIADDSVGVFVVGSIPLARIDDDGALYDLVAQTAEGGVPGTQGADVTSDDSGIADNPATVEIVFADGAGTADALYDGQHSSRDAYLVVTATIGVAKSSSVVTDPINGAVNPKAIPGATVRYTITVSNTGSAGATSVVIVDTTPTNTTYSAGTMILDGSPLTDGVDADEGDYNVTNSSAITVTLATLAAGGSATVTFDVTVD